MPPSPTPIWHPIDKLPLIGMLIDEQLKDCQVQLQNINPPRRRPVLDDALVERIIRTYSETQEMLSVFAEQFSRWKSAKPSESQRVEIERLERQLNEFRRVVDEILKVTREHQEFKIEKVMSRDDAEVGLDSLLGMMDRWR
jgi:hypothetical protein